MQHKVKLYTSTLWPLILLKMNNIGDTWTVPIYRLSVEVFHGFSHYLPNLITFLGY
jgi:hypothetical protein